MASFPLNSIPFLHDIKSSGTWSPEEKRNFKSGVLELGWGNWKQIANDFVPTRTKEQIKSHAQKFQLHHSEHATLLKAEHNVMLLQGKNSENIEEKIIEHGLCPLRASKKRCIKMKTSPYKKKSPEPNQFTLQLRGLIRNCVTKLSTEQMTKLFLDLNNGSTGATAVMSHFDEQDLSRMKSEAACVTPPPDVNHFFSLSNLSNMTCCEGEQENQIRQNDVAAAMLSLTNDSYCLDASIPELDMKPLTEATDEHEVIMTSLYFFDQDIHDPHSLRVKINFDKQSYDEIRAHIKSPPDFNDPKECIIDNNGMTRIGLTEGPLTRVRFMSLLSFHENGTWWRGDVASASMVDQGQTDSMIFTNKQALEHFVALVIVMSDMSLWCTVSFEGASPSNFNEYRIFEEEDSILSISFTVMKLWARVKHSLARGSFALLGENRMERVSCIDKVVDSLVKKSKRGISC